MPEYRFADLVDVAVLQRMADFLSETAGFTNAILDVDGRVLVAAGWQDVCTQFHRRNSETAKRCLESDTHINGRLLQQGPVAYKCKNGLWDVAMPVLVDGRHIATVFVGQFFYDDEEVDERFFRQQSVAFGFNPEEYLAALRRVPRFSHERVNTILRHYSAFVLLLVQLGKNKLDLLTEIEERKRYANELACQRDHLEDLVAARTQTLAFQANLLDQIGDVITATDLDGRITYVNEASCRSVGSTREELVGQSVTVFGDGQGGPTQQEIIDTTRAQGGWRGQIVHRSPEGKAVYFDARTRLVFNEQGEPTGMCGISTDITHLVTVQEELRRREQNFRRLVQASWIPMIVADPQFRILLMNDKFTKVTGYTLDEVKCVEDWRPLAYPDPEYRRRVQEGWSQRVQEALKQGLSEIVPLEVWARAKDGHMMYLECGVSFIGEEFLLSFNDLTERKRAEEALRESEERFHGIFMYAGTGVVYTDREGRVLEANDAFCRLIGYSEEELRGLTSADITYPEDFERQILLARELIENRRNHLRIEKRYITRTGDLVWCDISTTAVRGRDGRPEYLVTVVVDISERKRFERELQESEARFRHVIQSSPLGVHLYTLQPDGRLVFAGANPAADRILRMNHTAFLGMTIEEIFPPLARTVIPERYRRVAETGEPWDESSFEYQGEDVSFTYEIHAFQTSPGKIAVMFKDISERRRLERERRQLEERVQQAQKLESLGVLAGGVAHDFNNILMSILGNVGFALHDLPATSPARLSIEEVERAAQRAAELTRQMLAYSGRGRFVIRAVDLSAVVRDMNNLLRASVPRRIFLRLELCSDMTLVEADPSQLQQLLVSLVANAAESYGEEQAGDVTISTGTMRCDTAYLSGTVTEAELAIPEGSSEVLCAYIEVADKGCGMDDTTRKRLFEPFFSTKFAGRGLGMAAVLGIVRGHKGTMRITSEPGHGTTLRVLFPILAAPAAEAGDITSQQMTPRGKGTVLVVDDEEQVRDVARRMLERLGHTVLTAVDGHDAIEVFRREHAGIECVLIDLSMPCMDGEKTVEELRKVKPQIRVIVCSGFSEQEVAQRFADKGFIRFIQKPYQLTSLERKLKEVLETG